MVKGRGKTKAQRVVEEVARVVGAGKPASLETVDFSDPDRPKTCLEVDFPILPVNRIATIEGKGSGALKPIYQTMKWWARRRSTVFRQLLIAAATECPQEDTSAAKDAWSLYYRNHQGNPATCGLRVADIFMGGGTTVVEAKRLGMEVHGNDLNPVSWLVVKNAVTPADAEEVEAFAASLEASVSPSVQPFLVCDCPRGHTGQWSDSSGKLQPKEFDPKEIPVQRRVDYSYKGPETVYTFWVKHGPCQVSGCDHRTPVMTKPVFATKSFTVKAWPQVCGQCGAGFDAEEKDARLAPGVPLVLAEEEESFAVIGQRLQVTCPACGDVSTLSKGTAKPKKKRVQLTLLIHPDWLGGSPASAEDGTPFGGSPGDDAQSTSDWHSERSRDLCLVEVRGKIPDTVTCPNSGRPLNLSQEGSTVPKRSHFACGACGTVQDLLSAVRLSGKAAPVTPYAFQGYCPECHAAGEVNGGRFFAPLHDTSGIDAAHREWDIRSSTDLAGYWPTTTIPVGDEIGDHDVNGHRYGRWSQMFNPRQLLVHAQLLKGILTIGEEEFAWQTREHFLGVFQQYLRNQNMFCFWNIQRALEPLFSTSNFHPKLTVIENSIFSGLGRGDFKACLRKLQDQLEWFHDPWEIAALDDSGHAEKVPTGDGLGLSRQVTLTQGSSSELETLDAESFDLVVTDPPFAGLVQYAELADFFYVWLRLALKERYPTVFSSDYSPKALEAVSNRARHPGDADGHYQRLLTACWAEANRILKPGGLLVFTFHHSEDAPWIAVLESLFDAGFYLEATYPVRGDETKGDGQFGSQKIEYDIVHVCRKRLRAPAPVSWAKMRRQVIQDVRQLKEILERHENEGLPDADIQVIRRGKALEYYSKHYGAVLLDQDRPLTVEQALLGINQLLEDELGAAGEAPPALAEPLTAQFLRIFDRRVAVPRDQMQKYLRGTGIAPSDFEDRGWCRSEKKVYHLVPPITVAQRWVGKHRRGMASDYDQAFFLIGACLDDSGINAADTLNNTNFKPHPAVGALLDWFSTRGATPETRNAAIRARSILRGWRSKNQRQAQQISLFYEEGGSS